MTPAEVAKEASARCGWPIDKAQGIVDAFLRTRQWSPLELFLGFRAGFKCEYCGLDLLATVDGYKLRQKDRIDPSGGDDPDNLALACLVCNSKLKNRWILPAWPMERSARVKIVQNHLRSERARIEAEIASYRQLLSDAGGIGQHGDLW